MFLHPGGRLISPIGLLVECCGIALVFLFGVFGVFSSPNAALPVTTSVQTLAMVSCGIADGLSSGFGA